VYLPWGKFPKASPSVKRTAIMGHRNGCDIAQL
jgi:hypothetical protein